MKCMIIKIWTNSPSPNELNCFCIPFDSAAVYRRCTCRSCCVGSLSSRANLCMLKISLLLAEPNVSTMKHLISGASFPTLFVIHSKDAPLFISPRPMEERFSRITAKGRNTNARIDFERKLMLLVCGHGDDKFICLHHATLL